MKSELDVHSIFNAEAKTSLFREELGVLKRCIFQYFPHEQRFSRGALFRSRKGKPENPLRREVLGKRKYS